MLCIDDGRCNVFWCLLSYGQNKRINQYSKSNSKSDTSSNGVSTVNHSNTKHIKTGNQKNTESTDTTVSHIDLLNKLLTVTVTRQLDCIEHQWKLAQPVVPKQIQSTNDGTVSQRWRIDISELTDTQLELLIHEQKSIQHAKRQHKLQQEQNIHKYCLAHNISIQQYYIQQQQLQLIKQQQQYRLQQQARLHTVEVEIKQQYNKQRELAEQQRLINERYYHTLPTAAIHLIRYIINTNWSDDVCTTIIDRFNGCVLQYIHCIDCTLFLLNNTVMMYHLLQSYSNRHNITLSLSMKQLTVRLSSSTNTTDNRDIDHTTDRFAISLYQLTESSVLQVLNYSIQTIATVSINQLLCINTTTTIQSGALITLIDQLTLINNVFKSAKLHCISLGNTADSVANG